MVSTTRTTPGMMEKRVTQRKHLLERWKYVRDVAWKSDSFTRGRLRNHLDLPRERLAQLYQSFRGKSHTYEKNTIKKMDFKER